MNRVIVPMNAFHHQELSRKGQEAFLSIIADAEAYGVELRRELWINFREELKTLKPKLDKLNLFVVYSAPIELWEEDGTLNPQLEAVFREAEELGAQRLKLSLGHYDADHSDLAQLKDWLDKQASEVNVLIENDQTLHGGNIENLNRFFTAAHKIGIPVGMTFDTGNWSFTGEVMEQALDKLSDYVDYVHFKEVKERQGELVTLPLSEEPASSWRKPANAFPESMHKALEFPLKNTNEIRKYISLVSEAGAESEENI